MTLTLLYVSRINELFNFLRHLKFDIYEFQDNLLKLDIFLDLTSKKNNKTLHLHNFSSIEFREVSFSYPNFAKEEMKYLEIVEKRIQKLSTDLSSYDKDNLHMIEEARKESRQKNPMILENINLILET